MNRMQMRTDRRQPEFEFSKKANSKIINGNNSDEKYGNVNAGVSPGAGVASLIEPILYY